MGSFFRIIISLALILAWAAGSWHGFSYAYSERQEEEFIGLWVGLPWLFWMGFAGLFHEQIEDSDRGPILTLIVSGLLATGGMQYLAGPSGEALLDGQIPSLTAFPVILAISVVVLAISAFGVLDLLKIAFSRYLIALYIVCGLAFYGYQSGFSITEYISETTAYRWFQENWLLLLAVFAGSFLWVVFYFLRREFRHLPVLIQPNELKWLLSSKRKGGEQPNYRSRYSKLFLWIRGTKRGLDFLVPDHRPNAPGHRNTESNCFQSFPFSSDKRIVENIPAPNKQRNIPEADRKEIRELVEGIISADLQRGKSIFFNRLLTERRNRTTVDSKIYSDTQWLLLDSGDSREIQSKLHQLLTSSVLSAIEEFYETMIHAAHASIPDHTDDAGYFRQALGSPYGRVSREVQNLMSQLPLGEDDIQPTAPRPARFPPLDTTQRKEPHANISERIIRHMQHNISISYDEISLSKSVRRFPKRHQRYPGLPMIFDRRRTRREKTNREDRNLTDRQRFVFLHKSGRLISYDQEFDQLFIPVLEKIAAKVEGFAQRKAMQKLTEQMEGIIRDY